MKPEPDEADKTWWASKPPSDRTNEKLRWKRRKYPPEPADFRAWMDQAYPRHNPGISWEYLWDNLRDIIREYEQFAKR